MAQRGLAAASDGRLYGTARSGGPAHRGVVFRIAAPRAAHTPWAVPGRIEAEDYDLGGPGIAYVDHSPGNEGGAYRSDDVDIKASRAGGFAVGWFAAGEWLAYTVDVKIDGIYTIAARVGSLFTGRTFHIAIDGQDVTGPLVVPAVSDWDEYQTVRRRGYGCAGMVSGWTRTSAERHRRQTVANSTQNSRSRVRKCGRFTRRCKVRS
jgi:uncharacterized repeat protein (TIGR03803 family)